MPCEGRDILTDTESDSGSSCNESSDCLETEIVTDLAYSDATHSYMEFLYVEQICNLVGTELKLLMDIRT